MKRLLGVDFGTTSLKGCVFDENGIEIATASRGYTLETVGDYVEFPADNYYNLFLEVFNELKAKTEIDAISIDTQGETIIFLDKEGKPLMNAIVWLDNRANKEAEQIESAFGLKSVYEHTGQTEVPAGYPAPKIMWLKKNKPELFAKLDKVLLLEDYLIYRMTGKFNANRSLYSSTLYLDVVTGEYWQEMLDFIGIDKSKLPALNESGDKVGEFMGATVASGALDQIAGFVGCGITEEGVISEMTGTCLAVCALSKKLPPYYEGIKLPAYYMSKGKYCLLMFAPTAGMVLEWYKKNFYPTENFAKINEDAEKVPFGSEGLTFAPNLCGSVMPYNDPLLKGGVYGIDIKHTRGHFARAIMESVACLLKQYLDYMNLPVDEIISIGGGANSPLWLQIKASLTGKTVRTLKNKETGCMGSAVFAGVAGGVYPTVESAANKLVEIRSVTLPKAEDKEAAENLYKRYLAAEQMFLNRGQDL